jgi:hypothetical protein
VVFFLRHKSGRVTSFLLRHYEQAEELGETFLRFNSIEFTFYNDIHMQIHDDDDR